jgi:hypothetical protein
LLLIAAYALYSHERNEQRASSPAALLTLPKELLVPAQSKRIKDVDRAKQFYSKLDWRLDADRAAGGMSRRFLLSPAHSFLILSNAF